MISVRTLTDAQWPAFAGQFRDLTYEQSLTYARAAADRIGAGLHLLALEQGGRPVAAAAVRVKLVPGLGRGIAWIASGPLVQPLDGRDPDDRQLTAILTALRAEIAERRGHVLRLRLPGTALHHPATVASVATQAGYAGTAQTPPYRSYAIDLRLGEAGLMQALDGKWRTDLRFALKSDLTLECGDQPGLKARFLRMFEEVQAAKGFRPDITPEFHFGLQGPDFPRDILIASKDGVDLAGIVIGSAGQTATYLFGATTKAGRPLRAGYLLTWEGIGLSRSRGLHWYDLGGVDFGANPDVARFKQRMNGVEIEAVPYQTSFPGPVPKLIEGLERLRRRLRRPRPGGV